MTSVDGIFFLARTFGFFGHNRLQMEAETGASSSKDAKAVDITLWLDKRLKQSWSAWTVSEQLTDATIDDIRVHHKNFEATVKVC